MYQPVPDKPDFPSLERRVLDFWEDTAAFETLRQKLADSDKRFSFIDGPITANNPMAVHHAWGRTYKDLYQRYKAMNGFNQRWQNGFDCQGLWVEVEVEKELGFATKRDIEQYGIAEFVQRCKDRVLKFARVITEQSIRLGQWMDWGDSYFTMSEENNYTIWRVIKSCHERGWLYRGHDVMPWCPRCGTGISHMEIETEGYKRRHPHQPVRETAAARSSQREPAGVDDNALDAHVQRRRGRPSGPDLRARRRNEDGQSVWLAEALVKTVLGEGWQVEQHLRGADMLEWRYRGPFDELPAVRGVEHRVIPWTDVSQEEGTGIVHIAPGCGEEDFRLGQEYKLKTHRAARRKRRLRRRLRLADRPVRQRRRAADRRQPTPEGRAVSRRSNTPTAIRIAGDAAPSSSSVWSTSGTSAWTTCATWSWTSRARSAGFPTSGSNASWTGCATCATG